MEEHCIGGTQSRLCVDLLSVMRDFVLGGVRCCAGILSNLRPASNEIISASVLLCETAVCLLQVQLIGTNVWLLQNAQHAPCRWFRVLKNTCKIGTRMCEMDVGNESGQAFATSLIPFGESS